MGLGISDRNAQLDKNRLYVTVFEGSAEENLSRDDEAASYWAKFLLRKESSTATKKIIFGKWGDTGPCGPCSEIHIDIRSDEERSKTDGLSLVNKSHPHVIEIWNLVFMQYNRKADGSLEPLPAKVIDTGMGFERLCMAVQGKTSNYDTDIFQPIIRKVSDLSGFNYGNDPKKMWPCAWWPIMCVRLRFRSPTGNYRPILKPDTLFAVYCVGRYVTVTRFSI